MESLLKSLPKSFAPKLLVKGNLTTLGTCEPSKLKNTIPVIGFLNHVQHLLSNYASVIMGLKALTGYGKSLCLPQFGWAAFDKEVNVTVTEPLVPIYWMSLTAQINSILTLKCAKILTIKLNQQRS